MRAGIRLPRTYYLRNTCRGSQANRTHSPTPQSSIERRYPSISRPGSRPAPALSRRRLDKGLPGHRSAWLYRHLRPVDLDGGVGGIGNRNRQLRDDARPGVRDGSIRGRPRAAVGSANPGFGPAGHQLYDFDPGPAALPRPDRGGNRPVGKCHQYSNGGDRVAPQRLSGLAAHELQRLLRDCAAGGRSDSGRLRLADLLPVALRPITTDPVELPPRRKK